MAALDPGPGGHQVALRSVGLCALAFVVGYVFSDVDRACGLVVVGAAGAGAFVGLGAGRGKHAGEVCVVAAAVYGAGLFTRAAVDDKLSLLPCAVTFMAAFAAVFLAAAWVARRLRGKAAAGIHADPPGGHDSGGS